MQTKIAINNIADVKEFVTKADKNPKLAWVKQGNTAVPANSLMGMFAIDTSEPFIVEFTEISDEFATFITQFKA